MIPYQNCEVYASILFFLATKILSYFIEGMYKQRMLNSIPEMEGEEDLGRKWVPKKKHEVLKAKYKCLKKLFQIYDASVIGILPEPNPEIVDETKAKRRRKRSHRTKTDACAGTNELTSGDNSDFENTSVATAIIRELHIDEPTQIDKKIDKYAETVTSASEKDFAQDLCEKEIESPCTCSPNGIPYLILNEKRKLTRFQCFVQRLFGIKRDSYIFPSGEMHAASDPTLTYKRRRRGMRFRRLRKPQKIKSESDLKSPGTILSFVQSVQRSCLMDKTPRQCPIIGCRMISYGIINYNDHLNLCHFKDRKYICHYCHEGFEREYDKLVHEDEHIGISKIGANLSCQSTCRQTSKIASNTQTDPETKVPEEKLKKIVSFFEKISNPDQILTEIKKNHFSASNLRSKCDSATMEESGTSSHRSSCDSNASSRRFVPLICRYCGERFNYRRQLSLHVDLEHRVHNKFSKYHSCAGIVTPCRHIDTISEQGSAESRSNQGVKVKRVATSSTLTDSQDLARSKSDESLTCDPSTNIVYYTSMDSGRQSSTASSHPKGICSYRWEPGTKIIRV